MNPDIKPEHRANLLKLAQYLLSGELEAEFDMRTHGYQGGPTCGSVGCAIGHATYAVEKIDTNETWTEYSNRIFGMTPSIIFQEKNRAWHWMFSAHWHDHDRTPEGAGKRILWYLYRGVPNDGYIMRYQKMTPDEIVHPNELPFTLFAPVVK